MAAPAPQPMTAPPPQPMGYPPPQQSPGTVVVQTTLGPYPKTMTCPHCQQNMTTRTIPRTGLVTWLGCLLCCLGGLWLGCCLIPFHMEACQDIEHKCSICGRDVGVHTRCG